MVVHEHGGELSTWISAGIVKSPVSLCSLGRDTSRVFHVSSSSTQRCSSETDGGVAVHGGVRGTYAVLEVVAAGPVLGFQPTTTVMLISHLLARSSGVLLCLGL